MLDSTEMRICLLGDLGFHGKAIVMLIRKYEGDFFSVGTIYKTLKKHGIRLRDYRDCKTPGSKEAAAGTTARMLASEQKRRRKR